MRKLFFSTIRLVTFNYYFQKKKENALVIFMFHQVNDKKTTFYPAMSVSAFRDLCSFIKQNYVVIYPSEINTHFTHGTGPAAIISFDDAHYDIVENALPVLSELELKFNVNVDTEILETGKPQDFVRVYDILNNTSIQEYMNSAYMQETLVIDRLNPIAIENKFTSILSNLTTKQKRAFTEDLAEKAKMKKESFSKMLSKEDIEALCKHPVEFGSHSHTHSILTKISEEQVLYELQQSKKILEDLCDKPITVIAYPNGVYNSKIESIARSVGYSVFLQTDDQVNYLNTTLVEKSGYKRINQYHQTVNEALAHTYGVLNWLKRIKK